MPLFPLLRWTDFCAQKDFRAPKIPDFQCSLTTIPSPKHTHIRNETLHPKNFSFRCDSNTAPGTSLLVLQTERRNCRTRTCILKYGASNLFSYTSHNQRIGRFRASTALSGYMIHKVFRMILKVFRSSDAMMEQLRDSSILAREDLHEELRRLCI